MNKTLIFALIGLISFVACANYSVLVAGSKGYENYRHQADICHAYQTLIKKGFAPENIIVFLYNDVAFDKQNPFKGQLFNKPFGDDVYAGCKIDYQGEDVTPKNYMSVLTGKKSDVANIGTGRVLESTENDNVFLYFSDHGAPGIIGFPSTYMYANELIATFQIMKTQKMYNQLVYYLETCESGSMFVNLPTDLNIYAVSAANPTQSSYAAYCGIKAFAKGKLIGSCLGDLFSVNWMEEIDSAKDIENLTLQQQFEFIAKKTKLSQIMQWGDLSFTSEPVSDFLTSTTSSKKSLKASLMSFFNFSSPSMRKVKDESIIEHEEEGIHNHDSLVNNRKAKISTLLHLYTTSPSTQNFEKLNLELHDDQKFQNYFDQIQTRFGLQNADLETAGSQSGTNFTCYKTLVESFESKCGKTPESQLSSLSYFYQFCQRSYKKEPNYDEMLENIC
ncbi:hypothetical protein ABPG74_015359 [Tetrahymena malaccensis]